MKKHERQDLFLVILFLVVVGSLVILLVYGVNALILAIPILLGGALILLLPFAIFFFIGKFLDWYNNRQ